MTTEAPPAAKADEVPAGAEPESEAPPFKAKGKTGPKAKKKR